jgi:hypothetical protein
MNLKQLTPCKNPKAHDSKMCTSFYCRNNAVVIWFEPLSSGEVRTAEDVCASGCNWNRYTKLVM